jgi:hypothetical protein
MSIAPAGSPDASLTPCMSICETPLRLVFIEQWTDHAALLAHFAVPASRNFVRALQPLAAAAATIEIYDATRKTRCIAGLPHQFHIAMQHHHP